MLTTVFQLVYINAYFRQIKVRIIVFFKQMIAVMSPSVLPSGCCEEALPTSVLLLVFML